MSGDPVTTVGPNAAAQIRSFLERVERLEEEKKAIASDIKDVFAEAKANGFDTKVLRKLIALRKLDPNEAQEAHALLGVYGKAIGLDWLDA